ncbi:MAG: response regulator [Euryarchaeota archaeon]|nr:response regulator [Euryarchaeota archaeon]
MKIDEIDKQILAILEQDADASSTAIAETLDIAPETVKERLDRLADTRTKILVVDDEPDTLIPLTRALEADNYAVIGAADGAEALEKVAAETPDLILLDLMLPKVNGYEVCMKLKEDSLTRDIPIIMLSAKGEIKDKVLGIEIGAEDYVTKPFDLLELKTRIRALLRRSAI